jgi:1,4-dihydroxy-2-naphthoate octaprenyltransferase
VLTPACVLLGISTALSVQPQINFGLAVLVLVGAVLAHASVNMLNEYVDFKSGLDFKTNKTKFSGGSGALPSHPEMAGWVLTSAIGALLTTIIIGLYIIFERGLIILPIGLAGVVVILTYTPWLNRIPWLGLVASGSGFGLLMVVGTHVVLTGKYSQLAWLVSLVPFFLVNNLLLLNQYPDLQADASVGRKTFPVSFGMQTSNIVYAVFMLAAYGLILLLVTMGSIPRLSIIAVIPMGFSLFALRGAIKYKSHIGEVPKYLAANVVAAILTPLLLGVIVLLG